MLDIKLLRTDKEGLEKALQKKDPTLSLNGIAEMDADIRKTKTDVEALKKERNDLSQKIGLKKRSGEDAAPLMAQVGTLGSDIEKLDRKLTELESSFHEKIAALPNPPLDEIPISEDPKDNVEIKRYKEKRDFAFEPKHHMELNETLGLFDFKRGAKLSGAGWPLYRRWGARLEWALLQYMVSVHVKNGFEQWIPPILVREDIVYGSGQLPKFRHQQFSLQDEDFPLWLIPTSEVVLNGLHSDEVIPENVLPLRYFAYTPCFRREAGAAGANERGLIRVHQFNKVEMFAFTKPEESEAMFNTMIQSAEEILKGLDLHYRLMLLVTGDTSFAAAKTVDVEVWLPGQNRYYEVSSVSNCSDYQARRSHIRYRAANGKLEFVHTLNGSGLATSRLMVSLLENNQEEDGSIRIPEVLRPFLGGKEKITKDDAPAW